MALAEAIGQLNGEAKKEARDTLAERLSRFKPANILAYMRHENLELRRAAALACALKDDKAQVGKLIELLEDPELSVQRAAFAALKSLTAQDFGPAREATEVERSRAIAAWKAWWKKQTGL
jgi:HEAT repeat protein